MPPVAASLRRSMSFFNECWNCEAPLNLPLGVLRRGAAVSPSEEFRGHAAECERMATSRRGDEKATWSQMAARWLACAKQADDAYASVQCRIEAGRAKPPRRTAARWTHEPRVS